ncbi:hypothetical protein HK104_008084, partial [Borealophlyctis nickersoniae]
MDPYLQSSFAAGLELYRPTPDPYRPPAASLSPGHELYRPLGADPYRPPAALLSPGHELYRSPSEPAAAHISAVDPRYRPVIAPAAAAAAAAVAAPVLPPMPTVPVADPYVQSAPPHLDPYKPAGGVNTSMPNLDPYRLPVVGTTTALPPPAPPNPYRPPTTHPYHYPYTPPSDYAATGPQRAATDWEYPYDRQMYPATRPGNPVIIPAPAPAPLAYYPPPSLAPLSAPVRPAIGNGVAVIRYTKKTSAHCPPPLASASDAAREREREREREGSVARHHHHHRHYYHPYNRVNGASSNGTSSN